MRRRHPKTPIAWLITDERLEPHLLEVIVALPRGSGVLVRHHHLLGRDRGALIRRIRILARMRGLHVVDEAKGSIARVHSAREIAKARLSGAELFLISPLFGTRTHPDWKPLPRMKAAALARLARGPAIALGGMSARRFRTVASLGFVGWAAIDAWAPPNDARTSTRCRRRQPGCRGAGR